MLRRIDVTMPANQWAMLNTPTPFDRDPHPHAGLSSWAALIEPTMCRALATSLP